MNKYDFNIPLIGNFICHILYVELYAYLGYRLDHIFSSLYFPYNEYQITLHYIWFNNFFK